MNDEADRAEAAAEFRKEQHDDNYQPTAPADEDPATFWARMAGKTLHELHEMRLERDAARAEHETAEALAVSLLADAKRLEAVAPLDFSQSSADAVVDVYRARERDMWADFVRKPSHITRTEHFRALMALLQEIDSRADAVLRSGR